MKYFAIYSTVKLLNQPDWLDNFRQKYDLEYNPVTNNYCNPYEIHITITQPRFIADGDIDSLKLGFTDSLSKCNYENFNIEFSNWHLDRQDTTNDGCIMIKLSVNEMLLNLQKILLKVIGDNQNYIDPKFLDYEKNFVPHITIGRSLSGDRFESAISILPDNLSISARLDKIVLAIVPNNSVSERLNPDNLTVFKI